MKIKALFAIAGFDYTYQKGGEYDVDKERGLDLVKAGLAIEIKAPKVERAANKKFEKRKK